MDGSSQLPGIRSGDLEGDERRQFSLFGVWRFTEWLGNENSARSFSDRSSWKSLRVVDVRAFWGHGCPRPNACFSRILSALTEVLGRDIRANDLFTEMPFR